MIETGQNQIATSAELAENAVCPQRAEVHADHPPGAAEDTAVPADMLEGVDQKSPARWAYERLLMYISNFEENLAEHEEVAMGLTGSSAGVIRIGGIGYFDPDMLTFYGKDTNGAPLQLVQHVSQLNVLLTTVSPEPEAQAPRRIGFRLQQALHPGTTDGEKPVDKA